MVPPFQEASHMSQASPINPALSPGFDRARKLSRFAAVLFALAFLVMLLVAVATPVAAFFPKPRGVELGFGWGNGVRVNFAALKGWRSIGAIVAVEFMVLPSILTLYHTFRLFFCFTKGEVFAAQPISHIRAAGLWLTISFFSDIAGIILLRFCGIKSGAPISASSLGAMSLGIATIIAAYVMEEARRIAADSAEIV
jgi:hypothetical protein